MVTYLKKHDVTEDFSAGMYILKCLLFFGIIAAVVCWNRYLDFKARLQPEETREKFIEEARIFYSTVDNMRSKNFDLVGFKKDRTFFKKFAGFFDIDGVCDNYTDPCLWNNMTYKTLDGEITPSFYRTPNIGQFRTKTGALYMLYSYDENDLRVFVDINGINKKPNRFGADVFAFYMDSYSGDLKYMGDAGTPYRNMNLYCNPYTSNKFNGFACPYKAILDKEYFNDTFKVIYK